MEALAGLSALALLAVSAGIYLLTCAAVGMVAESWNGNGLSMALISIVITPAIVAFIVLAQGKR